MLLHRHILFSQIHCWCHCQESWQAGYPVYQGRDSEERRAEHHEPEAGGAGRGCPPAPVGEDRGVAVNYKLSKLFGSYKSQSVTKMSLGIPAHYLLKSKSYRPIFARKETNFNQTSSDVFPLFFKLSINKLLKVLGL